MDHEEQINAAAETASRVIADAATVAKDLISKAAGDAIELTKKETKVNDERITKALSKALTEVFDVNIDSSRFVDVTKIPLLCASVINITKQLDTIKSDIRWVVKIVIGAVILGLLALIFKK